MSDKGGNQQSLERDTYQALFDAVRNGRVQTSKSHIHPVEERVAVEFGIPILRVFELQPDNPITYRLDGIRGMRVIGIDGKDRLETLNDGPFESVAAARAAAQVVFLKLRAAEVPLLQNRTARHGTALAELQDNMAVAQRTIAALEERLRLAEAKIREGCLNRGALAKPDDESS